jgi:uncharacterized protein YaaQ
MKLILAIVDKNTATIIVDLLIKEKIFVTKLATTGGFLKSGNTTLIIGAENSKVNKIIDVFSKICGKIKQKAPADLPNIMELFTEPLGNTQKNFATIFVLNIEQYEKIQ